MLKILFSVAIGCGALGALLFFGQRSLIYFPAPLTVYPQAYNASDLQVAYLETSDHLKIYGWYKPPREGRPLFIYFHGNGGHLGMRIPFLRRFLNEGYGLFLLSYRGYAGNPGSPTEQGLYKDARAAIRWVLKQTPQSPLVLYGESLGSAVAIQMALEYPIDALILQSPFTSLTAVGHWHYPFLPVKLLLQDKFESLKKMENIHVPVLVIHGQFDPIVPVWMGEQIYTEASQPKVLKIYPNKHHNDLGSDDLVQTIHAFLKK